MNASWNVRLWSWDADPLADVEAWRAEAEGEGVLHLTLPGLDFNFQSRGPVEVGMVTPEAAADAGLGRDGFAIIATTTLHLEQGRWRIRTVSDDGVRLFVDDEMRLERWDIHGPTPDAVVIEVATGRDVALRVEHFEKDGWAALSVLVEPAD